MANGRMSPTARRPRAAIAAWCIGTNSRFSKGGYSAGHSRTNAGLRRNGVICNVRGRGYMIADPRQPVSSHKVLDVMLKPLVWLFAGVAKIYRLFDRPDWKKKA